MASLNDVEYSRQMLSHTAVTVSLCCSILFCQWRSWYSLETAHLFYWTCVNWLSGKLVLGMTFFLVLKVWWYVLATPIIILTLMDEAMTWNDRCLFMFINIFGWGCNGTIEDLNPYPSEPSYIQFWKWCRSRSTMFSIRQVHTIRIYNEYEGRREKSVPRTAVRHSEAGRVMTNGDPEGRIFLSYPHTNLAHRCCSFFIYLFWNKLPEVPEYAKMQFQMMTFLDVLGKLACHWVR